MNKRSLSSKPSQRFASFACIWLIMAFAYSLLLQGCSTAPAKPAQSIKSLAAHITQHIEQPRFSSASWGIKIVSLDTQRTLFEHNAQKHLIPASNTKLFTGALALETLAPGDRIFTELYATGPVVNDRVLAGDLVLYGRGDPTLGATTETGAFQQPFDYLVAQLARTGLKRVHGDLIINDSYFATPSIGTGWEVDDLQWPYGAEVSSLTLDENAFMLSVQPATNIGEPCEITSALVPLSVVNHTTTALPDKATGIGVYRQPGTRTFYIFGSLAIDEAPQPVKLSLAEPAEVIGNQLLTVLANHHIVVDGRIRVVHWFDQEIDLNHKTPTIPPQWRRLAVLPSPPITDIVRQTFKQSQNLYAQTLLLQVGQRMQQIQQMQRILPIPTPTPTPTPTQIKNKNADNCASGSSTPGCTTEQGGIDALNAFLRSAGISADDALLEEGSGLSRRNLVTPAAITTLLQYMNNRPTAQFFKDALPIAGVDGTLKNRMKGTAAENNVRAKTGNLTYVYTLSGYVTTAAKERLAFSIMLNNYNYSLPTPSNSTSTHPPIPMPTDDIDAIAVMLAEFAAHS